jgi:hypothetical protein
MPGLLDLEYYKKTRPLYQGEDMYFKSNPQVGGMASEDNYVLLNPYSTLSDKEKEAVRVNEAARLYMNAMGVPNVSLTREQQGNLAGTTYSNADPMYQQATTLARILSQDPSSGIPTMQQLEAIKPMLFLRGLLTN